MHYAVTDNLNQSEIGERPFVSLVVLCTTQSSDSLHKSI